jgi:putative membrane protein
VIINEARFASAIEAKVTEIEKTTSAELVVVAAPRSGSYADVALAAGCTSGFLALLFLVFSPLSFSAGWLPLDFAIVALLAWYFVRNSSRLTRLLCTRARRSRQVKDAATVAFVEEAVHGTRQRTGVLFYWSELEGELFLLRDHAVDGKVPGAEWNAVPRKPRTLDEFLEVMSTCGRVLAAHLPPVGDNPDEIPNAPRVRR